MCKPPVKIDQICSVTIDNWIVMQKKSASLASEVVLLPFKPPPCRHLRCGQKKTSTHRHWVVREEDCSTMVRRKEEREEATKR